MIERNTLLSMLAAGKEPLVLDEAGEFEQGDGMRVTLLPHHILFEVVHDGGTGHILLALTDFLDALVLNTRRIGN